VAVIWAEILVKSGQNSFHTLKKDDYIGFIYLFLATPQANLPYF